MSIRDDELLEEAKRKSKQNPWTGLIHNEDGSMEFLEGGKVEGANNIS